MHLQDRALYNLLRFNWREDPSLTVKKWQVEDYRSLNTEDIFKRLKGLGIVLDQSSFLSYAISMNTPEELSECLWLKEEDDEGDGQAYLLLFELWRRFCPDRQTLSIFCDELDHQIDLYDRGALDDEEKIQACLQQLEDIFDRHVDLGMAAKEVFDTICQYCAHDLERFLFDFITDQIDAGNTMYASELVDGFYSYVRMSEWFDFLKVRLLIDTAPEEAELVFQGLLEQIEEKPPLELLFEMATFLSTWTSETLFFQAMRMACRASNEQDDLFDLLEILAEHYRLNDRELHYQFVQKVLAKRDKPISLQDDPDFQKILAWLQHPGLLP